MMNEIKSKIETIDEYISKFPVEVQTVLQEIREVIRNAAPEAVEKISYQMPTFYLYGNLVHFAAFKKHIGLYPSPSGIEAFKEELSIYKSSKGAVQFPLNKEIPYDLIHKIVVFRVNENKRNIQTEQPKSGNTGK